MKKKGRIQPGMDADLIVFDMDKLEVRATYTEPNQHTLGMQHVLVNGVPIIQGGKLDTTAFPGQAVRRPVQD
jgi:N-acyl-D-glutamate deacylase